MLPSSASSFSDAALALRAMAGQLLGDGQAQQFEGSGLGWPAEALDASVFVVDLHVQCGDEGSPLSTTQIMETLALSHGPVGGATFLELGMWGNLPRRARWIAAGYVVGFGEGACSHVYSLWTGGIHAFSRDPVPIQVLFHTMLVLDVLAVVLIVRASTAGPPLAAVVILADAFGNWWTEAGDVMRHPVDYLVPFGLLPITLFGVFVLATTLLLHRGVVASRTTAGQALEQLL